MGQATPAVHLRLHGDPEPTRTLRQALDEIGARYGVAKDDLFELKVAATEALTNAIKGAGKPHGVDVAVEPQAGAIDVEVRNRGAFRLRSTMVDEVDAEGGRGIPLMFALVDEVEFASTVRGTRVKIRKRFRGMRPADAAVGIPR